MTNESISANRHFADGNQLLDSGNLFRANLLFKRRFNHYRLSGLRKDHANSDELLERKLSNQQLHYDFYTELIELKAVLRESVQPSCFEYTTLETNDIEEEKFAPKP